MKIMLIEEDNSTFQMFEEMMETLNRVACDELEAQGHTPYCAGMLVSVINTSSKLLEVVVDQHQQMLDTVKVNLTLVVDDTDEG